MTTHCALTTLPGEAAAEALAAAMERMTPAPVGTGVFEIEDGSGLWEVGGYFDEAPSGATLDLLAAAFGARPFAVSDLPDIDWVAKVRRELAPVEAGRFFVFGSHDADRVPEGRVALQVEATVAFGTGHHGTTLGCLMAFDRLLDAGFAPARVADVGCGTAVLAMAAARTLPGAAVTASDIDAVAVDVARANIAINGLEGRVACIESDGFAAAGMQEAAPFDLVFANILKGPLIDLAPAMAGAVTPGGLVILSGLLGVQAEAVIDAYAQAGLRPEGAERSWRMDHARPAARGLRVARKCRRPHRIRGAAFGPSARSRGTGARSTTLARAEPGDVAAAQADVVELAVGQLAERVARHAGVVPRGERGEGPPDEADRAEGGDGAEGRGAGGGGVGGHGRIP